ncbi:hypothetical protein SUGI_0420120 [Cryptomeria japonica]|nr:hypothetical protein SUGI_0420120 [Cryptomeria japonica]
MVWEVLELSGIPNLSDFISFLARLQRLNSKAKIVAQHFDIMFDRIIEEQPAQRADIRYNNNEVKEFFNVLLDLNEDGTQLTLVNIKGMLMVSENINLPHTYGFYEYIITEEESGIVSWRKLVEDKEELTVNKEAEEQL